MKLRLGGFLTVIFPDFRCLLACFLSLTAKIQESMIGNGKFSRKRGRMFSVGLKERGRIFSAALKEEGRRGERANEGNEEVR